MGKLIRYLSAMSVGPGVGYGLTRLVDELAVKKILNQYGEDFWALSSSAMLKSLVFVVGLSIGLGVTNNLYDLVNSKYKFNKKREESLINDGLEKITSYEDFILTGRDVNAIMKKIAKKGEKERLFYYLDLSNALQDHRKIKDKLESLASKIEEDVQEVYRANNNYEGLRNIRIGKFNPRTYERLEDALLAWLPYKKPTLFVNLGNKKGRVLWELEIFLEKIAKNPDINLVVGITDLERAQQYKEKYGFDLKILGYREYNPL